MSSSLWCFPRTPMCSGKGNKWSRKLSWLWNSQQNLARRAFTRPWRNMVGICVWIALLGLYWGTMTYLTFSHALSYTISILQKSNWKRFSYKYVTTLSTQEAISVKNSLKLTMETSEETLFTCVQLLNASSSLSINGPMQPILSIWVITTRLFMHDVVRWDWTGPASSWT